MSRIRRRASGNLRPAPASITPELVARLLGLADRLAEQRTPQPAPRLARTPRVKPTITIEHEITSSRPAQLVEATEEKRELGVRPDSPSSPEGGSATVGVPDACEPPRSEPRPQPQPARELAPVRVAPAPVPSVRPRFSRAALEAVAPPPKIRMPAPSAPHAERQPAAGRKPVPISWVEREMARSEAAIAFLRGKVFALSRVLHFQTNQPTGRFHVSGYTGEFDRRLLVQLAESRGFEG